MMDQDSDSDLDLPNTPVDIKEAANLVTLDLLPVKSRVRYENEYEAFMKWRQEKHVKSFSESVILAVQKSSTLWSRYSMLKACLVVRNNVDNSKYSKLIAYLKRQSVGYKAKKSKIFTKEQILNFLSTAPDEEYLLMKVIAIIGLSGACRCDELKNMTIDDIQDMQSALIITIPDSKTGKSRVFTVVAVKNKLASDLNLIEIYRKYVSLRPSLTEHRRLFVNFRNNKCTIQPVGINKFAKVPAIIAKYLKISDASSYTGHCWRRTSASLLVDAGADLLTLKRHGGWKSSAVAGGYIENSMQNKIFVATKILGEISTDKSNITLASTSNSTSTTNVDKKSESFGVSINAKNCTFNFYNSK